MRKEVLQALLEEEKLLASKPVSPAQDVQSKLEGGMQFSKTKSLALGGLQGASFGFADEIEAGIKAIPSVVSEMSLDPYRSKLADVRKEYSEAQEANPMSFLAGNVGGGIATSFVPGLGALNAAKGLGALKAGAGIGAVAGLGASEADLTKGELSDALIDTAIGGTVGAAIPGAVMGAKKVGGAIKNAGLNFLGVEPSVAAKYAADASLKEVPSSTVIETLKGAKGAQKEATEQIAGTAKEIATLRPQVALSKQMANETYKQAQNAIKSEISDASNQFKMVQDDFINAMKGVKLSDESATVVKEGIDSIKGKIVSLSDQAGEILSGSNQTINRGEAVNILKKSVGALKGSGVATKGALSDSTKAAINKINGYIDNISSKQVDDLVEEFDPIMGSVFKPQGKNLPDEIPVKDFYNSIVKEINSDLDSAFSGQSDIKFDAKGIRQLMGLRKELSDKVKEKVTTEGNTAFVEAMQGINTLSKKLTRLPKSFGNTDNVAKRLDSLISQNDQNGIEIVKDLMNAAGKGDVFEKALKKVEKSRELASAAKSGRFTPLEAREPAMRISGAKLMQEGLQPDMSTADQLAEQLLQLEQRKAAETVQRDLIKDPTEYLRQQVKLSGDKELTREQAEVLKAMTGRDRRGSSGTNLGQAVGEGLGGMLTKLPLVGPAAKVVGAGLGFLRDDYGPRAARSLIDATRGVPSVPVPSALGRTQGLGRATTNMGMRKDRN